MIPPAPGNERRRDFDRTVDSLTAQMRHLAAEQTSTALRVAAADESMQAIRRELRANTEMTESIRDALIAGKVATKVLKWTGAIAMAVASIYTAAYMVLHNGVPPPGSGGFGPGP